MISKFFKKTPNRYAIILFILIQIVFVSFSFLYYVRTNINSEFYLIAKEDCTIKLYTPLGNDFEVFVKADDTTVISKRPLSRIEIIPKNSNHCSFSPLIYNGIVENQSLICVFSENDDVDFYGIILFFTDLNFHVIWILISVAPLIFLLLFNFIDLIRYCIELKIRLLKHIVKSKPVHNILLSINGGIGISNKQFNFLVVLTIIFLTSLFIGLGQGCIQQKESGKWRALVALEMNYSANYVSPTLNGEYYYNKPPLFNYLLLPIVDDKSNLEFKLRSVTAISVVLLGILAFSIARTHFNLRDSFFASLLFLSSAVIYLVFAAKLMIDPFFAIIIVLMFFVNFRYAKSGKYFKMFVYGYLLASIGFLTKGMPAIYFQFVSLVGIIMIFKLYRKVFSLDHLYGLLVFFFPISLYLLLYSTYNNPFLLLKELFFEVTYKLNTDNSQRFADILSFAGKSMIAYSPLLLFFPMFLVKELRYVLFKDLFSKYIILISFLGCFPFLLGNFYPQYILMFIPFIVFLILRYIPVWQLLKPRARLLICLFDFLVVIIAAYFSGEKWYVYAILSLIIISLSVCLPKRLKPLSFAYLIIIIGVKFGVLFINKAQTLEEDKLIKQKSKTIIELVDEERLYLYPKEIEINHASMFYLTYYYSDIIRVKENFVDTTAFYLSYNEYLPTEAIKIDSILQNVSYKHPDPYGEYCQDKWLILFKL